MLRAVPRLRPSLLAAARPGARAALVRARGLSGSAVLEFLTKDGRFSPAQAARAAQVLAAVSGSGGDAETLRLLRQMGDVGLDALQQSVSREESSRGSAQGDAKPVTFHVECLRDGHSFSVTTRSGETLYDVVHSGGAENELRERLECACGGEMMCSTCHVYVDAASYVKLPKPEEAELDMLDLAYEFREGQSRLGCQVRLSEALDGMRITLPKAANNFYGKG
jgi:ferredoxin